MKTVTWIQIASKQYGGRVYGQKVRQALAERFSVKNITVEANYLKQKYLKPFEWAYKLLSIKTQSDLWIRDDFNVLSVSALKKSKGKNVAVVYHIDPSVLPWVMRTAMAMMMPWFMRGLRQSDGLVVISDYWRQYFSNQGFKQIKKIYPAFNFADFEIPDAEVSAFKQKYNLLGKPIVYLGNCQKAKGVVEAYEALKDLDVFLVTSGAKGVDIPALNINGDYREYLCLLKAASVAVTMSKFKEGWCMTAHEAMLCKTPVIGSGLGGMQELLEGGKQIICKDVAMLKEKVLYL